MDSDDDTVRLTVPATPASLRLARLVAASLANDLGMDVEEIEDVRVAVDELGAVLLDAAGGGEVGADGGEVGGTATGTLELDFATIGGALEVRGSATPPSAGAPEVHAVAAELLGLLVDDYEVGAEADRWWFRLVRSRRADATAG